MEYLVDLNAAQASIRAGYSEESAKEIGYENLTKPHIQEEIQRLMNERKERVQITSDYVLNNIIEISERCMQKKKVMVRDGKHWVQKTEYDDDGNEQGVWEFDARGALKAQELLGKHIKLFGADSEGSSKVVVVMPTIKIDGVEKEYDIGSPTITQSSRWAGQAQTNN